MTPLEVGLAPIQPPWTLLAFSSQRTDTPGVSSCVYIVENHNAAPLALLDGRVHHLREARVNLEDAREELGNTKDALASPRTTVTTLQSNCSRPNPPGLLFATPAPAIKIKTADHTPPLVTVTPAAPDGHAPLKLKEVIDLLPKFAGSPSTNHKQRAEFCITEPTLTRELGSLFPLTSAASDKRQLGVRADVYTLPEWTIRVLERFSNPEATRDATLESLNLSTGAPDAYDDNYVLDLICRLAPASESVHLRHMLIRDRQTIATLKRHVGQSPSLATPPSVPPTANTSTAAAALSTREANKVGRAPRKSSGGPCQLTPATPAAYAKSNAPNPLRAGKYMAA
ncbi:hypothetical protein BDK51DRAFT_25908 [Blyttiomyces helicus]|uniref:Uncharacterized protein n=1 Tax=Blyttiomyces helicus TaxID=388810 RepID=A0A4P9WLV6_9FUNG|nr:hypothetical protein BDK51DRAFT_25908 [Blyttiomyces helicus]|eukprot:RKO94029.1 hypothetical protein BDK51DRAFT_25908 [Blyttiomyces helicus]